jgi:hypothetical protein
MNGRGWGVKHEPRQPLAMLVSSLLPDGLDDLGDAEAAQEDEDEVHASAKGFAGHGVGGEEAEDAEAEDHEEAGGEDQAG